NRPPGGALLAHALPGGASDIDVRLAQLAREPREKARGGNAASGPAADVRHVGEIGAQLLLVDLPQRHLPDAVPGVVGGLAHLVGELLVVGEQAARDMPEGDDAGAGERSEEHTSELQSPYDLVCRLLLE